MNISGFTFIHNALVAGFPLFEAIEAVYHYVDEVVVVDMESTDGTRERLMQWKNNGADKIRVVAGQWYGGAGGCLRKAHAMNRLCVGDFVIHFEADEVYDNTLLKTIKCLLETGIAKNIAVQRLQVEQNFQRIRWYPRPVHRVFRKGTVTKFGETTQEHIDSEIEIIAVPGDVGYLWDIANCFRDNWITRVKQNAELWGDINPVYKAVYDHGFYAAREFTEAQAELYMREKIWTLTSTPLFIPRILKPLLGKVRYEPTVC